MRALVIGDVVAKAGRKVLTHWLPRLVEEYAVDFALANVENAAGGYGVTISIVEDLLDRGLHCLTSGNHIWDQKEILPYLDREPRLLRPINYPAPAPGRGHYVGETAAGIPVAVVNLQGRAFMPSIDCPFRAIDHLLRELDPAVKVILVDMHAEATSEKVGMGWYLDGKVSAVFGTHTHVQTADERVLPRGTAHISDLGMTGPYDSVLGMRKELALERLYTQRRVRLEPAKGDPVLCGVVLDIDETTGEARSIERLRRPLPG